MEEFEFNKQVVPLRDRMFRYARSLLLSAVEAEDVTHDMLERLWRDRDSLGRCRNIDSFVMSSVRNRCYDLLRQRRAVERRDNAIAGWTEHSTVGATEQWEARELVRRAMDSLSERQREVLHLKDIEGYPTHEIAEMVACDQAQVRVLLSRARHAIREVLIKMMDDERA
ncbi:RNA polymerase sigma factor [uncultured Alistipes sp.]|jgi:RNA polymerase sigma factor, sigma-70 family|uniref:RNA polymerase sigma factor n=1 Tax=uncultured Alistipes sp. TaxID=538949 RepID=UPI0025EFF0A2|nr:RNA polymerase sigma factor [uncultured Alistipes sp.]